MSAGNFFAGQFFAGGFFGAISSDTTTGPSPLGGTNQDYRWFDGQEPRPNWYEYPEEKAKLKAEIVKVAKAKKAVERQLSFAKGPNDLQGAIAKLNALQERLAGLMEFYRQALAAWQAETARRAAEDEEEAEFMEMLVDLL